MKGKDKKSKNRQKDSDRGLLSHVQNPDDLEIGTIIKEQVQGNDKQLINEESPDDLEIANGRHQEK